MTKRKKDRKKRTRINVCIDLFLSLFVVIVPLIAITLYALGIDIPKMLFGIYVSVVFIIAGIIFITLAFFEKFDFGKAGTYFNKIIGWKQLTKALGDKIHREA